MSSYLLKVNFQSQVYLKTLHHLKYFIYLLFQYWTFIPLIASSQILSYLTWSVRFICFIFLKIFSSLKRNQHCFDSQNYYYFLIVHCWGQFSIFILKQIIFCLYVIFRIVFIIYLFLTFFILFLLFKIN